MFEFQSQLIFPTHAVPPAGPIPRGAEILGVNTPDGNVLKGILIPPDEASGEHDLILGFGGNGWNGQDVAEYLHGVFPDWTVAAFHYRGYAPSTGSPSSKALVEDAPLLFDEVTERVKSLRAVAVGFSIGSGVAAELARQRHLDGLILVTPFDSLKAVAQSMYPWLPIGRFFEHEIDAASALENCGIPVAVIAAEHDEIVPGERTDGLRSRLRQLVFDQTIGRAGHNNIYARSDFQEAMREALASLIDGGRP